MKKIINLTLIVFITITVQAQQTIDLTRSHNPMFFSLEFVEKDIKKIKVEGNRILITTKLMIDFNGRTLKSKEEKQKYLSTVKSSNIKPITKITGKDALDKYGKNGKKGVLKIKTE